MEFWWVWIDRVTALAFAIWYLRHISPALLRGYNIAVALAEGWKRGMQVRIAADGTPELVETVIRRADTTMATATTALDATDDLLQDGQPRFAGECKDADERAAERPGATDREAVIDFGTPCDEKR